MASDEMNDEKWRQLCEEMTRVKTSEWTPDAGHEPDHVSRGVISELKATAFLLDLGYEVFRNVAPRGGVDLIATKGDKVIFVDVKTRPEAAVVFRPRATAEQLARNVKFLVVDTSTGWCELLDPVTPEVVACRVCGNEFIPNKKWQRYCSGRCRTRGQVLAASASYQRLKKARRNGAEHE